MIESIKEFLNNMFCTKEYEEYDESYVEFDIDEYTETVQKLTKNELKTSLLKELDKYENNIPKKALIATIE